MAGIQNFRSAMGGFNRQDVVNYIEYMNNKHNAQVEQLNNQLQAALSRPGDPALQAQLEAAQARIQELEAQLAQGSGSPINCTEQELEAYRRAERTERQAQERAQQIYDQANAVLAEATVKAEALSSQIRTVADNASQRLKEYQQTIDETKEAFSQAVATLYAIRPEEQK